MKAAEWSYLPKFLTTKEADELYGRCLSLPWEKEGEPWQGEEKFACHFGVSYSKNGGPREKEIPEIPAFLWALAQKVSKETKHPVNYVQCHRAAPEHIVNSHRDPAGMCVPMICVGQERTFHINSQEKLLQHGSLLIFNGGKIRHSMQPAEKDSKFNANGSKYRISLLFRYTTPSMREHGPGPKAKAFEYQQAVYDFQNPQLDIVVQREQDRKQIGLLASLDKARLALREAKDLSEIKKIHDIGVAARAYAQAADLSKDLKHHAEEIILEAKARLGEVTLLLERGEPGKPIKGATIAPISPYQQAIQSSGMPKRDVQRCQQVAAITEKTRRQYIEETKKLEDAAISAAGLVRFVKASKPQKPVPKNFEEAFLSQWDTVREKTLDYICDAYRGIPPAVREKDLLWIADQMLNRFSIRRAS